MDQKISSPWIAVSVGIVGLILGYTTVISQGGSSVFATAPRCQATHNTCASGECTKECPHNCFDPAA